jgi:cation diffusion facilitator CzcD-associated flavoprotein CzcO
VARDHGVERFVRFGDEVLAATYGDGRWRIETASGHRDEVDVVIAATGVLHHPRYPDIAGLDSFEGACFHSARWDHDVELDGARVGVIGTGSTAIQITSALVGRVEHYSLFQRTAQWILPSPNPAYTEEEKDELRHDPEKLAGLHQHLSDLFDVFADGVVDAQSPQMQMIAERCRLNLEENVHDPDLRERLRPDYQAACKRLVMSGDFYEAIQQPNAELVTSPIVGVERDGVRTADGVVHELDVLVLATGFQVDAFLRPMSVVGRGGVRLDDVWAERPSAYLSISIPEFPNLFLLNGPNGPVGNFSLIEVAELQFGYITALLDRLRDGAREISASQPALDEFEAARTRAVEGTVWVTGCNSWYLDDRGIPAVWPWPFSHFRERMSAPDLACYDVR